MFSWIIQECYYYENGSTPKSHDLLPKMKKKGFYLILSEMNGLSSDQALMVDDLPLILKRVWNFAREKANLSSSFRTYFDPDFRELYLQPYTFNSREKHITKDTCVWPLLSLKEWKPLLKMVAEEKLYYMSLGKHSHQKSIGLIEDIGKEEDNRTSQTSTMNPQLERAKGYSVDSLKKAVTLFTKAGEKDLSCWSNLGRHIYVSTSPGEADFLLPPLDCPDSIRLIWLEFMSKFCPLLPCWFTFGSPGCQDYTYLHTSLQVKQIWLSLESTESFYTVLQIIEKNSPLGFFTNPLDEQAVSDLPSWRWRGGVHAEENEWLNSASNFSGDIEDESKPGFLTPQTFSMLENGWKQSLIQALDEDSRDLVFVYWWLQAYCLSSQATELQVLKKNISTSNFANYEPELERGRFSFLPFHQFSSKISVLHPKRVLFSSLYLRNSGSMFLPVQTVAARKRISQCLAHLIQLKLVESSMKGDFILYKPLHFANIEKELLSLLTQLQQDLQPCDKWLSFVQSHLRQCLGLKGAPTLSQEQIRALDFMTKNGVSLLSGQAGTGKSTTAACLNLGLMDACVVALCKMAARELYEKVQKMTQLLPTSKKSLSDFRMLENCAYGSFCPCALLKKQIQAFVATIGKEKKTSKDSKLGISSSGTTISTPFVRTVEWMIVKAKHLPGKKTTAKAIPISYTPRVQKKRKIDGPELQSTLATQSKVGILVGKGKPYTMLVDEAETISLFRGLKLLRSIVSLNPNIINLVFMGDAQQTPAIGIGNLQAFLENHIPTTHLSKTYRYKYNFVMEKLCSYFSSNDPSPLSKEVFLPSLSRKALARVFLDQKSLLFIRNRFFYFLTTSSLSSFPDRRRGIEDQTYRQPQAFQVVAFRRREIDMINAYGYEYQLSKVFQVNWCRYISQSKRKQPLFLGLSVVVRHSLWLSLPDSITVLEQTEAARVRGEIVSGRPSDWRIRSRDIDAVSGTQGVVVRLDIVRVHVGTKKKKQKKPQESQENPPDDLDTMNRQNCEKVLMLSTYLNIQATCALPANFYSQPFRPREINRGLWKDSTSTSQKSDQLLGFYKGFWLRVTLDTGRRSVDGKIVCEEVLVDINNPFQNGWCLELGYALSVHSVTGSQYKKAVVLVSSQRFSPLHLHSRRLVYTVFSRNKIGPPEAWRLVSSQVALAPQAGNHWWEKVFRKIQSTPNTQRVKEYAGIASLHPNINSATKFAREMHTYP